MTTPSTVAPPPPAAAPAQETLQETCDSRGLTLPIDAAAGVIRGVKILGRESRNGRTYPAETLAAAAGLYEGCRVNVNHPRGPADGPRDYQDRLGTLRSITAREDGLFGDLHFNPHHALAEQLSWDARHAPENLGLSHNVAAEVRRDAKGATIVERINRVNSVDLVADPATTRGLFEAAAPPAAMPPPPSAVSPAAPTPDPAARILALQEQVAALTAAATAAERQATIRRLLAAAGLPAPDSQAPGAAAIVSEAFLATLTHAIDDRHVQVLIEDRAAAIRQAAAQHPRSQAQGTDLVTITSPKHFAQAIT